MRPGESQSSERIPPKQKSPTILFEVFIGSFLSLECCVWRIPGYTMRTVEASRQWSGVEVFYFPVDLVRSMVKRKASKLQIDDHRERQQSFETGIPSNKNVTSSSLVLWSGSGLPLLWIGGGRITRYRQHSGKRQGSFEG
jgi:hypothetical protein